MPTAAKLVAGLCFAFVAYLAAAQFVLALPGGRPAGVMREVSAVVGLLCGWFILGGFFRKPRSFVEAAGTGIRTSVTLAFVLVIAYSIWDVLGRAVDGRYRSPLDSVLDVFARLLVLGQPVFTPGVLGVLLVGGILGGACAHFASTRWK